jgi:RimJ/RimL family protein N-acetyltransferase
MDFEQKKEPIYLDVTPDDIDSISDYYKFEIDQGFSEIPEGSSFENMVKYRQEQLARGELSITIVKEDNKIVGTVVTVLKDGTMGKKLEPNEAWAAGTVVAKDKQNLGLGKRLADEQDRIARLAKKEAVLTTIKNDNFSSMRVYLKSGYQLEALDRRENEMDYIYKKDLTKNNDITTDWKDEVSKGKLKLDDAVESIDEIADQILVDPRDSGLIEKLLANDYKGVYLLWPQDFDDPQPIDKELLVFKKQL